MKKELRNYYYKKRQLNKNGDQNFINSLLKLVENFSNIALYMKINNEVNLEKLINKLFVHKNIYLPVVNGKKLEFRKFTSFDNLSYDDAKILAPVDGEKIEKQNLDCIVLPCLSANLKGYRLGHGGGYYDRYLQDYAGLKIGLVYENCLTTVDFQDHFDIPLDILVTEKKIIYIKERNNYV